MATLEDELKTVERELIRATTLRDEATKKLKQEFNCDTIEEAQTILKEMETDVIEREAKLRKRIKVFRDSYSEMAEDDG